MKRLLSYFIRLLQFATAWRNCTEACEAAGWDMDLVAQYHNMASYLESRLAAEDFFDVGSAPEVPEPVKKVMMDFYERSRQ